MSQESDAQVALEFEVVRLHDGRAMAIQGMGLEGLEGNGVYTRAETDAMKVEGAVLVSWIPAPPTLANARSGTLLARWSGDVVGVCDVYEVATGEWVVEGFIVQPSMRCRGVARQLWRFCVRELQGRGATRVHVYAFTREMEAVRYWTQVFGRSHTEIGSAEIAGRHHAAVGWIVNVR